MAVDGQKVTFYAGKGGKPITYYARVTSPGEYKAEEAVLQHQQSGLIFSHSGRQGVRIE